MNDLSQTPFEPAPQGGGSERRDSGRLSLIRTAKLIVDHAEYPCILRDVFGGTLRIKLYGTPLPRDGRPFHLAFGDGERFEVKLEWSRDGHAGLLFTEHRDLRALMGERGPFRKRAIRIAVSLPATVRSLGRSLDVVIHDLSHEGAQIASQTMFSMDQQVRLAVPALGEVYAKVRWRRHPHYGLAFVETFRFEEIAQIAGNLQALSKVWRDAHRDADGTGGDDSGIAA